MKRGIKGITLIALVVTIVVLLILSAVAIGLSIGDNGIIKQAQDAIDRWKEASQKEQNALGDLAYFINSNNQGDSGSQKLNVTVSQTENSFTIKVELEEENSNMEYEYYVDGELKSKTNSNEYTQEVTLEEKEPYIPTGFTHTTGEVDSGYVIKDTNNGNEFVWIPVAGKKYTVYVKASDGSSNYQSDEIDIAVSELTRNLNVDGYNLTYPGWYEEEGDVQDKKSIAYFKKSVAENGGFYMGRYEMGMPGQKSGDKPTLDFTNEARNIKGTPVCVAEVMPWTNIDYDVAKENIESMYNGEVQSAMLNSYARTTTFNWLGGTIGNYGGTFWGSSYSIKGSCYLLDYYQEGGYRYLKEYTNGGSITEAGVTGISILVTTGAKLLDNNTNQETGFVSNNIYDLGGNAGEWSTEMLKSDNSHRISGRDFTSANPEQWVDGDSMMYQTGTVGNLNITSRPILYK